MKANLLFSIFSFAGFLALGQMVEAENGGLIGTTKGDSRAGFSGTGYVTGFDAAGDAVQVTVEVSKAGLYSLYVGYAGPYGPKVNDIYINDEFSGNMDFSSIMTFTEGLFGKVFLNQGANKIKLVHNWGWVEIDYFKVTPASQNDFRKFQETLINPNATTEAKTLYQFLSDIYGFHILSGQQGPSGGDTDLDYIESLSGKYPAVKGFDLIEYSPSRVERGSTSNETDKIIEWWNEKGGIPTCAWHWNAPKDLYDTEEWPWWRGFYTEGTSFDVSIAMNDNTSEEYELIIRDIDAIAVQLKKIQTANVPLLWRPLHEAEGRWFWWGAKGAEPLKWLWLLLYDRLTNHHELNNLIWVWTGTGSEDALDWYPGDAYVDIIGADIYLENRNYSPSFAQFDKMVGLHEGLRIITMSETGIIPDPDLLDDQGARWNWFCTWSGDFIRDGEHNESSHIIKVYQHEYVLTLDELPDFATYEPTDYSDGEEPALGAESVATNLIYPNPFKESVKVIFQESLMVNRIQITTLEGRVLKETLLDESIPGFEYSVSELPSAIYILRIETEHGIISNRVIKVD